MIGFFRDGKQIDKIDFVETDVGTVNTINIGIKNGFDHTITIKETKVSDSEVKILSIPRTINPSETKEMVISFQPSLFRRTPLELADLGLKVSM